MKKLLRAAIVMAIIILACPAHAAQMTDVNLCDAHGDTALMRAARSKNNKAFDALLQQPETNTAIINNKGETVRDILRKQYFFDSHLQRKIDRHVRAQMTAKGI